MDDFAQNQRMPEKLDLNDWIQFSLDSEEEIERQIALEELVSTGVPPYLVSRVREISACDKSETCRKLAAWVESIERARSDLKPQMRKLELCPINIIMLLENAEAAAASVITQMLRKAPTEDVLDQWRAGLQTESNPRMIQIGLTILGKFGQAADAQQALPFLENNDPEIICAALSLMQTQNPDLFKKNISKGLTSKSFRIQLHSIHLLRQIDLEESIRYIQAFLFNSNPLIRQKALRELMLVPFEKVETLFLQYLGRESQSLLLVKAGFVVAFNPSADFPLKIFDIFQLSHGSKRHVLQLILRQLVESIQSAGILKQTFDEYMNDLQQKIKLKRSELIIRCAIKDLASQDKNMRLSAVDRLTPYAEYPSIRQALKKHFSSENNDEVKSAIDNLVGTEKNAETEKTTKSSFPTSPDVFLELPLKEQRQLLKKIRTNDDWLGARACLADLLHRDLKKIILLEIVRLFGSLGTRLDSPALVHFLEADEPALVAAVIKAIGAIDIDVMLPHLNRFLADDDPRVKSAALEVYVRADKEGAVQYLASMLKSTVTATRRIGLSLLPQIDYSSAEPMLWNLLKYEGNNELRIQAGYMIAANPTKEGLFKLFAITHQKTGEVKPGFEELWSVAMLSAQSLFETEPEEIERECWEIFKADFEQPAVDKSAYAYNSLVGDDDIPGTAIEPEIELTLIEKVFLHVSDYRLHYLGATFVFVMLYFFFSPAEHKSNYKGYTKKPTRFTDSKLVTSDKSPTTQVGSDDWKGTLKSGARELLSGSAYASAIRSGVNECEDIRADFERNLKQHYLDIVNNPDTPEETRQVIEARLNPSYARAIEAWESGNRSEAEIYYESAVEDPQLNTVGKCMALLKLAQLAEERKDNESWLKWQDRFLKELKKMPGYENVNGFENFARTYGQMKEVSRYISEGGDSSAILDHLRRSGESDAQARESLDALKNMNNLFKRDY